MHSLMGVPLPRRSRPLLEAPYQWLVRSVLYPADRIRSGDMAELRYLRQYEKTQYLSVNEIRSLQLTRLRHLLAHAYDTCPYYRRAFDAARYHPSSLRTLDDFAGCPTLSKSDIQHHRDLLVSDRWPRRDLIPNLTGGSTGTPLSFFVTKDRFRSRAAATWRHNRWASWDIGCKVAILWGAARDAPPPNLRHSLRNTFIDRILFLNTTRITEASLAEYHARLLRFRPGVLLGYANAVRLFARFLRDRDLAVPGLRAIVTSAEMLDPDARAEVSAALACPVFDRYGCREVSVIASECGVTGGLHTMAEGIFVEVIKEGRPADPGEMGEIVVTDLLNLGMPLIRYRIGDMGTSLDGPCGCGRGLPRLQSVAGRVTDFLVGQEGQLVSGAALTVAVVARRPSLGRVQIEQARDRSVLFRIVPPDERPVPDNDLHYLREETRAYLGDTLRVDFEFVRDIPPGPSGKLVFCRSMATSDFVSLPSTAGDDAQ